MEKTILFKKGKRKIVTAIASTVEMTKNGKVLITVKDEKQEKSVVKLGDLQGDKKIKKQLRKNAKRKKGLQVA